ncbi:serine carboxypeptidase-like [Musa troglodytarum]|uniref:Serine carboxypeptidase-like n=1 Tax=Musa troglodytarum TaxID=320322 RepID=A0A9E7JRA4_9LILI|nr:serine carboxypeptidase-like [Musa troglodytarum]
MESTHVTRISCDHERNWSYARFEMETRGWVTTRVLRHVCRAYINFAIVSAAEADHSGQMASSARLGRRSRDPQPTLLAVAELFLFLLAVVLSAPSPALSVSTVTHLPGFRGPLPFHLETGYVEVDEVNGAELFYYFIPSEGRPSEDPLLLWLNGGPRCSALSGLVFEVGPLKFVSAEYNGSLPNLVYHPYSWTKVANMIFVDSPVGSGFSFSRRYEGYNANDMSWSEHVYKFLIKWFIDHPQFLSNPLYISGDSYGGKIVPIVAYRISEVRKEEQKILVTTLLFGHFQGYLIGNPVTGENFDENSQVPYAHGVGIISDGIFEFCSEIYKNHILEPKCALASPKPKDMILDRRSLKERIDLLNPPHVPDLRCRAYAYFLSYYWANNNVVRQALHIKKGTVEEWQRCNGDLPYASELKSTIKYHLNLTTRGFRALVYSGDHDLYIPFVGTKAWIKSLNFSLVDDWRSWHVEGQVAGYTMKYANNLTFATVKSLLHHGVNTPWNHMWDFQHIHMYTTMNLYVAAHIHVELHILTKRTQHTLKRYPSLEWLPAFLLSSALPISNAELNPLQDKGSMIVSGKSLASRCRWFPHLLPCSRNRRQLKPARAKKENIGGDSQAAETTFSLRASKAVLARSAVALFGLGFLDAGYSGDWSRIGVISKETEDLLKIAAYLVTPLCLLLVFYISDGEKDS